MRKPILLLAALLALLLAACGGQSPSQGGTAETQYLGKYICTAITMDGATLNPEGKWLELAAGGAMTVFLTQEADEAQWSLTGDRFTMTVAGETVATGTIRGEELQLEMTDLTYTFLREGAAQPQTKTVTAQGEAAVFTCYGGLYQVRYPGDQFKEDPAGVSDLYAEDGTKAWITKLDTQARVSEWLASFEAKSKDPAIRSFSSGDFTLGQYQGKAIVYQDQTGLWKSEALIDFGQDLGTQAHPMHAAYLYFTGSAYEAVWSPQIQAMVKSLTLGDGA